jgi:hypothetical protein
MTMLKLITSLRFSFQICVQAFRFFWRCLKKDNDVHDVPCYKCLTKVVATPLWVKWEDETPTPKVGDLESPRLSNV